MTLLQLWIVGFLSFFLAENCCFFLRMIIYFLDLPWGLPLGFPSMSPFGAFPAFGLPTPNFPSLNSLVPPTTPAFPPSTPSLSSTDPITDVWSNGLSNNAANMDYNEYVKQFGLLMNAFKEQPKQTENDGSKSTKKKQKSMFWLFFLLLASSTAKASKSKRTTAVNHTSSLSSSSDTINGKNSRTKHLDESHPRPTSTSSSSTSSQRSSSTKHPTKSSTSSTTRSKPMQTSTSTKPSTIPDATTTFDPLAFAAATTAGLSFPYFLPSLLSPTSSSSLNTNSSTSTTPAAAAATPSYPFSSLPPSLMNPAASLYPFLSPDWFTSPSKFMEGFANLPSTKSTGKISIDLNERENFHFFLL